MTWDVSLIARLVSNWGGLQPYGLQYVQHRVENVGELDQCDEFVFENAKANRRVQVSAAGPIPGYPAVMGLSVEPIPRNGRIFTIENYHQQICHLPPDYAPYQIQEDELDLERRVTEVLQFFEEECRQHLAPTLTGKEWPLCQIEF